MKNKCSRQNSFTLIELLVVVTIIAILAGMLLPALGATKNQGKAITCASNIKSTMLAQTAYASDHKERMLAMNNTGSFYWAKNLISLSYLPDNGKSLACPVFKNSCYTSTFNWYGKTFGVFVPLNSSNNGIASQYSKDTVVQKYGNYYEMESGTHLVSKMKIPSQTGILYDAFSPSYKQASHVVYIQNSQKIACLLHSKKCSSGFADGHSEFLDSYRMTSGSSQFIWFKLKIEE